MKAVVIKCEPGVNELVHTEPITSVMPPTMHEPKGSRKVEFLWEIGPGVDHVGTPVTEVAVLSVYSHHPSRKYYSATLRREQQSDGWRSVLIRIGERPAWELVAGANRFNRKDLVAFADHALDELRRSADVPEVQAVFGVKPRTVAEVVEQPEDQSTLDWLQGLVGGWIEPVQMDGRMEAYVNEEGKLDGLPRNDVATAFWFHTMGGEFMTQPGEYIAGPLAIVGPLDDEGDTQSVTDEVIAEVQAFVASPVHVDRLAKEAEAYLENVGEPPSWGSC